MKLDRFILLLSLSAALPACKGASPVFHDMALPPDCDARCPAGYTCDNGVCTGGNARALALDTQTFPVSGTLLVNGAPPQATTSPSGGSTCSGDQVHIQFADGPLPEYFKPTVSTLVSTTIACNDSTGAVQTRLPAGDYRMVAYGSSESTFPSSTVTVAQNIKVSGPITAAMWNATLATVSGTLTIDGAAPIASSTSCYGDQVHLLFADANGSSYSTTIPCNVSTGAFSLQMAPGTYRVTAYGSSYSSFPSSTFLVQPALQVSGAMTNVALAAKTVAVSGTLTIDGKAPTALSQSCSGDQVHMSFTDSAGSSFQTTIPCNVSTGAFSLKIAPGTYKVTAYGSSYSSFPSSTFVLSSAFTVAGPMSNVAWAPTTVTVAGTLLVDGAPPLPTSSCSGDQLTMTFSNDDGASFQVGIPCVVSTGAFTAKVAPGTYRVIASGSSNETSFPDGEVVVQRALTVTAPMMGQQWGVTMVPVMGTLAIDGAFPLPAADCSGNQVGITFVDDDGGWFTATIPCLVSTGAFSLKVTPGTYKVMASGNSNTSFPDNSTFTLINALRIE